MKLAIATLAASLSLATAAAAMIGPYERAVNEPAAHAGLFTTGADDYTRVDGGSASPEAEWNNGGKNSGTVFSTKSGEAQPHYGADAR